MGIIELRDVRKRYGDRPALDGVSLDVAAGEIFGLIGPNGAGKTTAVECMAGLRRPDAGSVQVLGLRPGRDRRALAQRIGVQLQHALLPPALRVWEALDLYASLYDEPRDWRDVLDRWGLAAYRDRPFGKLSGGQRQRLMIALALVGNPEVAFMDELTTGLDPAARRDTWGLVQRVRDDGVTVVLVSHFMDEVLALCDRVAVFHRGRVVAVDAPRALKGSGTLDDVLVQLVRDGG